MFIRAEQHSAASLGVLLVAYAYFGYTFQRYGSGAMAKVAGTGLVTRRSDRTETAPSHSCLARGGRFLRSYATEAGTIGTPLDHSSSAWSANRANMPTSSCFRTCRSGESCPTRRAKWGVTSASLSNRNTDRDT